MKITFIVDGEHMDVDLPSGERVLKAAWRLGLDETGFGDCGGNCVCSTCHVYVKEGLEHFDAPKPEEEDMLDSVFNAQSNSRLACQLVLKPEHDHVVVEVPSRM